MAVGRAQLRRDGGLKVRYWRLWRSFLRASILADTEYRLNIILRVLSESVWYVAQLSMFEVLYTHTDHINGWSVHAMRVFQGSLFLVDTIYILLFSENLDSLNGVVRRGDLDVYLVKPINAQFMVSMRRVAVSYLPNLLLVLSYLTWAIGRLPGEVTGVALGAFVVAVACGTLSYYAMRFMFGTLVIMLQDAGNVQFLWHQLFRLATRPDSLYPRALRYVLLSVVPVAFIASVPARVLTEGPLITLWTVPVTALLLWLSGRMWRGALRHYASASS